jgi:hypothetical protein
MSPRQLLIPSAIALALALLASCGRDAVVTDTRAPVTAAAPATPGR